MSENYPERTTRRLVIAIFGLGLGLGVIAGTLLGLRLTSLEGLIRADEAVWRPVEGVTGALDGRSVPVRMFYTSEGYQFIEYGDYDQWLFDGDEETLYYVGDRVHIAKRDGRWIARGVPLWKMTMENPKVDHDPKLFIKRFTGLRIMRFFNTREEKVEITIDYRH